MISSKMFFRSFRDGCFHDAFVLVEFIEETVREGTRARLPLDFCRQHGSWDRWRLNRRFCAFSR